MLNEYFTTMEGPYWKQIRGPGLSYGYSLRMVAEEGYVRACPGGRLRSLPDRRYS